MKRPLLYAALFVLSGIICGISADLFIIKFIAVTAACAALTDAAAAGGRAGICRYLLPGIAMGLFAVGFIRGARVSGVYESSKGQEFFSEYEASNPGEFDYAMYLKSMGIDSKEKLAAYYDGKDPDVVDGSLTRRIRAYCSGVFDRCLTEEDAGIFKAMLLGDRTGLEEEVQELYQSSGISHLLAVSGLHVGIIGMGVFAVAVRLGLNTGAAALIASALVFIYMLVCGSSSSTVRAACMLVMGFGALSKRRVYDMKSAMSLSAVVIMLWRPYQIFAAGFQLSFAAVIAVAVVSPGIIRTVEMSGEINSRVKTRSLLDGSYIPVEHSLRAGIRKWLKGRMESDKQCAGGAGIGPGAVGWIHMGCRLPAWKSTLIMSAAIQLTTLPIIAWHYFTFPVYGILLNFIVVPLMAAVVYSGLVVLLLSIPATLFMALGADAAAGAAWSAACTAAAPGHYVLKLYELLGGFTSGLAFNTVCIGRPELAHIIIYYLLMAATISLPELTGYPVVLRRYAGTAAVLLLLTFSTCVLKYREKLDFYVMALDMGQGDGFVIKAGERYITVDMGSGSEDEAGERIAEAFLLSRGITDIDLAVVSHVDSDHISGLKYLLEESDAVRVHALALPAAAEWDDKYLELKEAYLEHRRGNAGEEDYGGDLYYGEAAEDKAEGIIYLDNLENIISEGDMKLTCIYAGNTAAVTDASNRQSDVLLLEKGESFRMLFTGDSSTADDEVICALYKEYISGAGEQILKTAASGRTRTVADKVSGEVTGDGAAITVLKAAHHGSYSSTSEYFLNAVEPDYALMSYGANNSYGHPSQEVIKRLAAHNIYVISTCESGAVCITERGFFSP